MARLYTDGAEQRNLLFWDFTSSQSTVSNTNPPPYASDYYYGIYWEAWKDLPVPLTEIYLRARVAHERVPWEYFGTMIFRNDTTPIAKLSQDAMGHWVATKGDHTILQDSGVSLVQNQWYLVEIYFKLHDTSGRFVTYVDGTKIIDYTGNTVCYNKTTFDNLYFNGINGIGALFMDDIAVNDTSGDEDNSWCGDGIVGRQPPTGTSHAGLMGSDGNQVDNHLLIDDTPHDSDTTYVWEDGAHGGLNDKYTLGSFDGENKRILRVIPQTIARKTTATGHRCRIGILPDGGSTDLSGEINLNTSYQLLSGNQYKTNPVTGLDWTEEDVNALQAVIQIGTCVQ